MIFRCLCACLGIVLATSCASSYRMSVPNWQRYQEGELTGFLHAPGEDVASEVPSVTVQRVRGRFFSPATEWQKSSGAPLRPEPTVRAAETSGNATPDISAIDSTMFVVELRGPGSSPNVRTVATRSGVFDFGPVPNGTYTLKATGSGWARVPGWSSKVRTVVVSDGADAVAEITVW